MNEEPYLEIKIKELTRDIRIMEDIVSGKIENYTQHPIPVLQASIMDYKFKLKKLEARLNVLNGKSDVYISLDEGGV